MTEAVQGSESITTNNESLGTNDISFPEDKTENKNTEINGEAILNFDDYLNNRNNPKHPMKVTCFNANGLTREIKIGHKR